MQRSIKKMSSSSLRKKQLSLVVEEGIADNAVRQSTAEKSEAAQNPDEEGKQQDVADAGFFSSKQEVSEIGKPPLAVKKQPSPAQELTV